MKLLENGLAAEKLEMISCVLLIDYCAKTMSYGPGHAKNVFSGICGQRRPRSACASAQSDQGHRCPQTESLDTIECINGEQMPG